MLEKIRRPGRSYKDGIVKKSLSYFILGLICAMFLFIAPMGTQLSTQGVVAQVGPHLIRSRELKNIEASLKKQYQSRLNSNSNTETLQKQIRSQAIQYLINTYKISLLAKQNGFFISDKELRDRIKQYPAFQEKGRFLHSKYQAFLKYQNLNPSHFEERIRRAEMSQDWLMLFKKGIPKNQLEEMKKTEKYQYQISLNYVELSAEQVKENKLAELLKAKDRQGIDQFIKEANASWEKTDVFSLIQPIAQPIAQKDQVIEALLAHLPEKGLIPHLIRDQNKVYAIEISSFKIGTVKKEDLQIEQLLSRNFGKPDQVFENWLSIESKKIKVENKMELSSQN